MKKIYVFLSLIILTTINQTWSVMKLSSPNFTNGAQLPQQYTCDGKNINPAFSWEDAPKNTQSFALLVEDPDAPSAQNPRPEGPWVHWIVFNIPATIKKLEENVSVSKLGAIQGMTDSKKAAFHGACPPKDSGPHRYFFKLFALDTKLDLKTGATKQQLLNAMQGHVLTTAELMGTYQR